MAKATAQPKKKKVAILGGGPGSLSVAWQLSSIPNWQDYYEITVYQKGWRLGGKCASGVTETHNLSLEHGIHVFLGWYNNSFSMVKGAYDEVAKHQLAPKSPFKRWEDAFSPGSRFLIPEYSPQKGKWVHWALSFPNNDLVPGDGPGPSLTQNFFSFLTMGLELLLQPVDFPAPGYYKIRDWIIEKLCPQEAQSIRNHLQNAAPSQFIEGLLRQSFSFLKSVFPSNAGTMAMNLMSSMDRLRNSSEGDAASTIQQIIRLLLDFLEKIANSVGNLTFIDEKLRRIMIMWQLGIVIVKGILEDTYDPTTGEIDVNKINNLDFRAWLKKHGAGQMVLYSGFLRLFYEATFSFHDGYSNEPGKMAAGTALGGFLVSTFSYKGAYYYGMKPGTGPALISPIYLALKQRGVQFHFFNDIQQIHYHAGEEIEKITVGIQATMKGSDSSEGYDPIKWVNGVPCWPTQPLFSQLEQENALRQGIKDGKNYDLESPWNEWGTVETIELKKGKDFDLIALGIPIGVIKTICSEIIEEKEPRSKAWADMVAGIGTVQTQSVQLWLKPGMKELGLDKKAYGFPDSEYVNAETYANPLSSFMDSSPCLPFETWQDASERPATSILINGPMQDAAIIPPFDQHDFPQTQRQRVEATAQQWLTDYWAFYWPKSTSVEDPTGLDFNLLVDTGTDIRQEPVEGEPEGLRKFRTQYFRANVSPSERFTLALPYDRQVRLKTDDSGWKNLFLAGDWIDNGVYYGNIESTVVSGGMCAQAIVDHTEGLKYQVVLIPMR